MPFEEYITKEVRYIEWFSLHHHISIDEACRRWVQQGLAELYAKKYRPSEQTGENN